MAWKRVKIILLVIIIIALLVPSILYLLSIDHSKSYSASVEVLAFYDDAQKTIVSDGIYQLKANGLTFKTRIAGFQNTGNNVILLHGFPQTSSIWQPMMDQAASEGYRVVAFDQRGYSPGARPKGKEHYSIDYLVEDVLSVADAVGFDTFHLVGHDWGSSVGWKTVMDHPERIKTWTALSIPHIGVFYDALQNNTDQQKRSSYISTFQLPILPELLFVIGKDKMLSSLEGVWRDEEISEIKDLLSEHGAMTSALNWYRAPGNIDSTNIGELKKKVIRPTLYIWGNQDKVVAPDIIPLQKEFIEAPYKEVELDAGHSLIQEQRDKVSELLLEHWGEKNSH